MVFQNKPKFVTFDMNGTLIKFAINDTMRDVLGVRLPVEVADEYLRLCKAYRIDECTGEYKPFHQIVADSMARASRKVGIEFRAEDAREVYDRIPTWGPYPGVTEALNRLAEAVPLVIITNSDTAVAERLAANLKAPFEVIITAEQMGMYKPRLGAFEYMFDKLGVSPDEIVHVSASPMYDHRSAAIMGIENKVYVDRGFEHDEHWLNYERITDIADLPTLFGLPRSVS
ncbi:haloacid dehalogenase type II [Paenarthrobacter ureafaciens]|uniref:haloacid dehalogenase type II n=1 Tax=Paenarthrobacter TaxID=1742992 RepID=UPI0015B9722A|nr:haloacid dehalogenase type II [Paenarthrobacter sp. AT5]NWL29254.1 haloacid dehalogenase type II [Paenarthrobacter ureafaciens]WOC62772.1 haloacid dehalogenase type II [Paenarthrobacter sp. AT5]